MMRIGLVLSVFNNMKLEDALYHAAESGYSCVELCVEQNKGQLDLDTLLQKGVAKKVKQKAHEYGLTISALGNHNDGQLVLGPYNQDTDMIFKGTAEQKAAYGIERMKKTALLAAKMDIPVVCGFCGCEDFTRWFPWPDESAWDRMAEVFSSRWHDILDTFSSVGIKFAHECHPKQFVYNTETAETSIKLLGGRKEWGFNYDPANLMIAGVDPVLFIQLLGKRIYNVHAKDGEIVAHNVGKSGIMAHGDWGRIDRGFRFRIPGWGDLPWKKIITELQLVGYDDAITVEHEDATMGRNDGVEKAIDYLKPLILKEKFEGRWW